MSRVRARRRVGRAQVLRLKTVALRRAVATLDLGLRKRMPPPRIFTISNSGAELEFASPKHRRAP